MQFDSQGKALIAKRACCIAVRQSVLLLPAPICGCNAGILESKRPSRKHRQNYMYQQEYRVNIDFLTIRLGQSQRFNLQNETAKLLVNFTFNT